jgi:c-di-GMP phosphodiesterase
LALKTVKKINMNQPVIQSTIPHSAEVFLGRQPILNNKLQTIAYELLFRSKDSVTNTNTDDLSATSTVIVNILSQFGLEQVLGKKDGFLNVSTSLLLSETIELLPPERIVLEILEDVPINAQILARCQALKKIGFRLAIDGFDNRTEYLPLLPSIDFVKIDLSITPVAAISELISLIRKASSAKIIAEKVEHEELFLKCKELGFDAFQGYFFSKPTILKSKKPQPHQITLMRVMGMLLGDADLRELETLFKNNPSLTIGLLRLVNSVGIGGGRQKVESIRHAITVLGQKQLMRWVQLLLYASPDGQGDNALMIQVASRARLMELIAKKLDPYQANFSDKAFMVGMLSLADAVMQAPLLDVLNEIGLSEELKNSILNEEGTLGQLLKLSKLIELGDFESAEKEITTIGISSDDLLQIQLETMQWVNEIGKESM